MAPRPRQMLGLAVGGATVGYLLFARRRELGWGATAEESAEALPGDELSPIDYEQHHQQEAIAA